MLAQLFATRTAPETALVLVPLASVTALALAFIGQYGFDLHPCVLCIYQRWPFVIVAGLCLLAVSPGMRAGRAARLILLLCAAVLAANAAIAVYHVGVEQHWWAGTEACVGKTGAAQTLADLKAQIMAAPVTRCDDIAFSLFGVSMAGYNVLFSFGLALYAGLIGHRAKGI
ncbi:MAG: disulfide bond formation protein B [Alphaproteobacteria bacterium]|jgi:disulfide bond formation protein DsbB|nr:disulfide bond formation protein B [Alphaproteobacteria bacterium]